MRCAKPLVSIFVCAWLAACAGQPKPRAPLGPAEELESVPFSRVVSLARDGSLPAIHHACFSYMYGRNGAPKDEDQAFHYCSLGDAAGADSSTTLLAEILYYGSEKRRDRDRARRLYRKAAKQGHVFATYMVGHLMLENGDDRVAARGWLSLAAAQGSPQAIKELDEMDVAERDAQRH